MPHFAEYMYSHLVTICFSVACLVIPIFGTSYAQSFDRLEWAVNENGSELSIPYTGGFHNPQFSNMDLDGDGVEDLLVFDRDGDVIIPILVGPNGSGYTFAPEYKNRFPEIINWMLIRDYNNDGVPDIFTSTPVSGLQGITVYRGEDTAEGLSFEKIEFPDQPYQQMLYFEFQNNEFPIYVARIDIPGVIDVDGDGDQDILTFEEGGGVRLIYYENQSVELGYGVDSLIFERADECWGKFIESPFDDGVKLSDDPSKCAERIQDGGGSTRHSGSTVLPIDVDQDGALDILIGDNGSPDIVYMRNGQESESAFMVEKDVSYPSDNVPAEFPSFLASFHVDTDGDGNRDLLVSPNSTSAGLNSQQIWKYQRGGEGGNAPFQFVQNDFLLEQTIDLTGSSNPTWVDVDGDGRLDLVVGVFGYDQNDMIDPRLFYFRQEGSQSEPLFELVDDDYLNFSTLYTDPSSTDSKYNFAPVFADMDADGDLDIICGEYWGTLIYGENTAGPGQPIAVDSLQRDWMGIDVGQASAPMIYDFNGDGRKDLIVGERNGNTQNGMACGNINYFQNKGTSAEPHFSADPQEAPNSPCFGRIITQESGSFAGFSTPALIPIEGEEQMLVGANSGKLLRYVFDEAASDSFSLLNERWGNVFPGSRSTAAVADVDKDGVFEMIVGNNRGGLELFRTDLQTDGSPVDVQNPEQPIPTVVYPNPTHGIITIQPPVAGLERRVQLFSIEGRMITDRKMSAGVRQTSLDLSGLSDGIYFLYLRYADGRSTVEKVIKTP